MGTVTSAQDKFCAKEVTSLEDGRLPAAAVLAGSTYLYLCRAPENFTATAGSLFDGPILEDTLYRVEHTDGDVRLVLAQP